MDMGSFDICALATMLKKPDEDSESDTDTDMRHPHKSSIYAGTLGSAFPHEKVDDGMSNGSPEMNNGRKRARSDIRHKDAIWSSGEMSRGSGRNDGIIIPDISNDPRQRPVVDIQYKQNLSTEDVFLGMSIKTPGSASCEWILVTISMPGETDHNTFHLDLKEHWIELRSKIYILVHVLPHRINPRLGNAKWDKANFTLTLTLRIIRDLDVIQ